MSVYSKLENKWNRLWQKAGVYEPLLSLPKGKSKSSVIRKPFYNLMMFPYPSAEGLHIGGVRTFSGVDIFGRFKRMQGLDVFEPIGLDGFGIHSENYALKIKKHPMKLAKVTEKNFYRQLGAIGNGFAWNEHLETYDPEYYKWTQWIFVQMFNRGLAYRKKMAVNWCPSCKTVLADEQVISGECERCIANVVKKDLEQWFFRTTKYAERLLTDLEKIDWPEPIKIAQRNWIGRSEGASIKFSITTSQFSIEVFTTRPDTLFGATYLVLSPEHALLRNNGLGVKNYEEVKKYIEKAKSRSLEDRAEAKEKTGVELSGVYAINPANKEKIPIWVADYVLAGYGTGAIMAVPAHDERDFEFAKKYKLPIRQVIAPKFSEIVNPPRPEKSTIHRKTVHVILRRLTDDKILMLQWKGKVWGDNPPRTFIIGGVEDNEDAVKSAEREIWEETGYKNVRFVRKLNFEVHTEYFAAHKDENRYAEINILYFEVDSDDHGEVSSEEIQKHDPVWVNEKEVASFINVVDGPFIWSWFKNGDKAYTSSGATINSEKFSGTDSETAKWEITKFVGGERKTQFRLRDWLISRQRYWGPPIPMIYCPACAEASAGKENAGWQAVPEEDLPVRLPFVKNYQPKGTGVSPLAAQEKFYKVRCPKCKAWARRETDVSDTFLDSAWYFLRYIDPKNKKEIFSKALAKKWLPVNMYIGGAEHAVLHLLYVRFITKVFKDWGVIDFNEPFKKFRTHGLIIKDGSKMSKSKGNVVSPDFYFKKFGADAMRMYLAFLSPLDQGGDFRDAGISGLTRFLTRAKNISKKLARTLKEKLPEDSEIFLHQSIKKITGDIENLRYNTAISQLMMLLNGLEELSTVPWGAYEIFLKLLAPFAPFLAEESYQSFKKNKSFKKEHSIHLAPWPKFDTKKITAADFDMVIQINGRVRATLKASVGINQAAAEKLARADANVKIYLVGKTPRKIIFISNRLINFVV